MDQHQSHTIATAQAYEAYAEAFANRVSDPSWVEPQVARLVQLLPRWASVLDVGCGPGRELHRLGAVGLRTVGLDISGRLLRLAGEHSPASQLVRGEFGRLPFRHHSFEAVWAVSSLLHLPSSATGAALAEVWRVLKPGGVFFSVMQRGSFEGFAPPTATETIQAPRYFTFHQPDTWRALLETHGFDIEQMQVIDFAPDAASVQRGHGAEGWINTWARVDLRDWN